MEPSLVRRFQPVRVEAAERRATVSFQYSSLAKSCGPSLPGFISSQLFNAVFVFWAEPVRHQNRLSSRLFPLGPRHRSSLVVDSPRKPHSIVQYNWCCSSYLVKASHRKLTQVALARPLAARKLLHQGPLSSSSYSAFSFSALASLLPRSLEFLP